MDTAGQRSGGGGSEERGGEKIPDFMLSTLEMLCSTGHAYRKHRALARRGGGEREGRRAWGGGGGEEQRSGEAEERRRGGEEKRRGGEERIGSWGSKLREYLSLEVVWSRTPFQACLRLFLDMS